MASQHIERLEGRCLLYTYGGDANLDGFVTGDDYANIDFTIGTRWVNGDFNYDGFIDFSPSDFSGTAKNDVIVVSAVAQGVMVAINDKSTITSAGKLRISGNSGNDKIHIDLPAEYADWLITIHGGAGNDTIVGSAAPERIFAGDGNDLVLGNDGRDTIYAEGGEDSVRGGGGSDFIDGDDGNDTLRGDAGNDRISGGAGFDRIRGSAGNDSLSGGTSKDWIGGETGNDQLEGDGGSDVLSGGENDDILIGGAGDDACDGNDGDDVLSGGSGADQLFGSGGNDGFDPGDNNAEALDIEPADLEAGATSLAVYNTVTSHHNLTKTGGGTLHLTGANAGAVTLTGGSLDLSNNRLIVVNAPDSTSNIYSGIEGLVQSGRNSGTWTSIGVASGAQINSVSTLGTALFAGQTITGASTIAMYTYGGDANLDGFISADDYTAIDFAATTGANGWIKGDFNYDGFISGDDYTIIDFNIASNTPA